MARRRRLAGTSLIEILVVIVVFLIGILAVIQVFPGGFKVLANTRNNAMATQLARVAIEALKAHSDQLPERIVPARYFVSGGQVLVVDDSTRRPDDLGPAATTLNQNGELITSTGDNIGQWRYASGANVITRIVGEGRVIPAPRPLGTHYGGLMTLQFGPVFMNAGTLGNPAYFPVYGNDLSRNLGDPSIGSTRPFQYFIDEPDTNAALLYLPQVAGAGRNFRVAANAYIANGGSTRVLSFSTVVGVPAGAGPYYSITMDSIVAPLLGAGDSFIGIEYDSLRVARVFNRLNLVDPFTDDPYEYKLLDTSNLGTSNANLGTLLFNPRGYNYIVPTQGGRRVPLSARVDYDVYDWGVIKDEVRVPLAQPYHSRLTLGNLKVRGNPGTDGRPNPGLGFVVPNGSGGTQSLDVVLVDTETGGVYLHNPANQADATTSAYSVDKSIGLVRFNDADGNATNGLQLRLIYPGDASATVVDAGNRSIRAMYQANGEWSVQVLKAANRYTQTTGVPTIGQFYLGDGTTGLATRIYFPWADVGREVTIGEAFYQNGVGFQGPANFTLRIEPPAAGDALQLPHIDIRDFDASATTFDGTRYGYAVRQVRGASVAVRVLWNGARFNLTGDTAQNMTNFDRWGQNWRRTTSETFLQRSGN